MAFGLGRCVILAAALVCGITAASAEVRIQSDYGGSIGSYLAKYRKLRDSGQPVVIDGPCVGACTLVVAMIPSNRICVTPKAVLGFLATSSQPPDAAAARKGTRLLTAVYPPRIKSWIARQGGLTAKPIFLRGRELASLYRSCT